MKFNRGQVVFGNKINTPTQDEIKNTQGLWNASFEDAIRFGGELTRAALQAVNLRGDRKHIVVDVKTHMLMPGMMPAIPGWHTDGVPRGGSMSPAKGEPDITMQKLPYAKAPHYHLLVTGGDCPTQFLSARDIDLLIPSEGKKNSQLYAYISSQIGKMIRWDTHNLQPYDAPDAQFVEWDWWELHTAQPARAPGWRYLIRVTETDYLEPQKDLRLVLRNQQQVYLPSKEFGW